MENILGGGLCKSEVGSFALIGCTSGVGSLSGFFSGELEMMKMMGRICSVGSVLCLSLSIGGFVYASCGSGGGCGGQIPGPMQGKPGTAGGSSWNWCTINGGTCVDDDCRCGADGDLLVCECRD